VPRKLTALGTRGRWALVELPVAPPAAVLRGVAYAIAPDDALDLMYPVGGGIGVPRGTVVLRGRGSARFDHGAPQPCAIERWQPGAIDLTCTGAGFAVVSSTAADGWSVTVDDLAAGWATADVLRRAVAIDAGTHRIAWRYTTPGFGPGAIAALVGAALLVALWLATRGHG
jgi:hypothetical protein